METKLLRLSRVEKSATGIYSKLVSSDGTFSCETLEHAYANIEVSEWNPIIPPGQYVCKRGQHQLDGMIKPFTTFEVTGVEGHTGLLFHKGNTEKDSHGCVLLGLTRQGTAILHSSAAFTAFLQYIGNDESFNLEVIDGNG